MSDDEYSVITSDVIKSFDCSIVLTVIHTFRAEIEQLSLAFEIMVKCSHAGPSNKSVNIF